MPRWFACPYLDAEVELTDEREVHIHERHSELVSRLEEVLLGTLGEPDAIHPSPSHESRLLVSRWFGDLRDGKHVLVVVERQTEEPMRYWIVTAYMLRKPVPGEALWRRS